MKHFLFLFSLIILVSCSAYQPPKTYNFPTEMEFDKTYDEVWTRVISLFADAGIPIKTLDKASGLIATESNLGAQEFATVMDCGTPASDLNVYKFENQLGKFNVQVISISPNRTKVKVRTFFKTLYVRYTRQQGYWVRTGSQWIDCNSTGAFEALIFNYLSQ